MGLAALAVAEKAIERTEAVQYDSHAEAMQHDDKGGGVMVL